MPAHGGVGDTCPTSKHPAFDSTVARLRFSTASSGSCNTRDPGHGHVHDRGSGHVRDHVHDRDRDRDHDHDRDQQTRAHAFEQPGGEQPVSTSRVGMGSEHSCVHSP